MASTALALIQQAAAEMGIPVPAVAAGSQTQDTIQLLALLNAVAYEIQREFIWQGTNKEYRFTTQFLTTTGTTVAGSPIITGIPSTAGLDSTYMVLGTGVNQDCFVLTVDSATQVTTTQGAAASGTVALNFCKVKYSMPSDYDRQVDRTQWDKTRHWEMIGPQTAQQWQWLKSGYIATGPRINWRIQGGTFEIWPPISSAEYLGFEYMSNAWAYSAAGVAKTSFTVDTDTCIFPDRLMVLGLKKKYFEIKGFDSTVFQHDYQSQLDIAKANDAGSKTLAMATRLSSILITQNNIPDSGYGTGL